MGELAENVVKQAVKKAQSLDDAQVAEFLEQKPEFFQEHEALLDKMTVPHPQNEGVVSLLEHLVQRQRQQITELNQQMETLLQAARDNERVVMSLHQLALELMNGDSLDDVVAICSQRLRSEFNADNVVIRLIGQGKTTTDQLHFIAPDDRSLKQMAGLFSRRQPVCGRLRPKQKTFLFGDNSDAIKSAVLIPLLEGREIGVMALGSEDETRFHPGMGILFISQLGELVSRAVSRHIDVALPSVKSGA